MAKKDEKIEEFLDAREAAENGDPAPETGGGDGGGGDTDGSDATSSDNNHIWMRGLWMLILALLFGLAETVLLAFAVLQFLWMLFSKEKNSFLSDAGETTGKWLHAVARFQTGATDEKPFLWRRLD